MADLENQYNIYADIAQSSYKGRDDNFPYEELSPSKRNRLDKGESVKFNFPHAKDAHGNDASTIYLVRLRYSILIFPKQNLLQKRCTKK